MQIFIDVLMAAGLTVAALLTVSMLVGAAATAVLEWLTPNGPLAGRTSR